MTGEPLAFATIASASLSESISFYRDVIGFDLDARGPADPAFIDLLGLPQGTTVECALLSACGLDVGRILLFDTGQPGRTSIRNPGDRVTGGLWNINFYVDDIFAVADALGNGFEFWSAPQRYRLGAAGEAIEVVFEGPDGVAINLVQPLGEPDSFIGRIRTQASAFGRTRTGFTPISTTAQCVRDVIAASRFYQAVLGMAVVLEEELGRPETNIFLARPAGAVAHTIFLEGRHFFGKLSLSQPLNFEVPDRLSVSPSDARGYVAQGFLVAFSLISRQVR